MQHGGKEIRVRKNHICAHCGNEIEKGDIAILHKGRAPRFDDEDIKQIGIYYYREYTCLDEFNCMENKCDYQVSGE